LIQAAANGDVTKAMWCVAHKGSSTWVNAKDRNRTALHAATAGGYKDTTVFLLINGGHAAIRQVDADGQSPLSIARERRDPDILRLFVECERGDYL
jgi:Ankyrin repeats (3 copies)